jgi:hypothetical protein
MFSTIITDTTFSVVIDGEIHTTDRSNMNWDRIKEAVKDPSTTEEYLINLLSPAASISAASADFGEIEVSNGILLFNGQEVHSALANRILDIYTEGLPLDPWVAFARNVFANPDVRARDELYLWLEKSNLPITPDGHFWAFKKVRKDFKDIYTGTMDNSPGTVVSMPREDVDPNRDRTCSQGLHFCSKDYLPHFGSSHSDTVVLVKVNPADVVSIPSDYDNAKGRTWRYEVVKEVDFDPQTKVWGSITNADATPYVAPTEELEDLQVGDRVRINDNYGDLEQGWEGTVRALPYQGTFIFDENYEVVYDPAFDTEGFVYGLFTRDELDLIPNEKTKKETKKKEKKLATKNKSKKAVTINTVELGVLSRKQFKQAVKQHGSVAAWARSLGVPAGTVGKWKARLWPKEG